MRGSAAERMMARQPRWAEALVALRNMLVAPFGLKTSGAGLAAPRDMIGIFPVVSETPDRLIAGFNDKHLDFRVVVDVAAPGGVRQVTATTLVKTHNWLGRTYLAIIMPFHRLIVPRHAASGCGLTKPVARRCVTSNSLSDPSMRFVKAIMRRIPESADRACARRRLA